MNISSLGGIRPWAEHAHYCASKAGVIMLTRALAKAFAPKVTVNSVAPGVIPFGEPRRPHERFIAATPAPARAVPPMKSPTPWYSFSNATKYVTGQILAVDGGLSQK